jgi:hypothetical protein
MPPGDDAGPGGDGVLGNVDALVAPLTGGGICI